MESIETWMITISIIFIGFVSQFAVNKYQNNEFKNQIKKLFDKQDECEKFINESSPLLKHLSKTEDETRIVLTNYGESLTALKEKTTQAPTMKEVRDEFVSKEMFKQLEKHMDGQFAIIQEGQAQIIQELREKN